MFLILGLVGFGSLVWIGFGVGVVVLVKQNLLESWALLNLSCLDVGFAGLRALAVYCYFGC